MEKTDSIKTNPNAIKTNAMKHSIEDSWGIRYQGQIERNIGILSIQEQDVLRSSKVAVLGVGGIGAPLLLNLCYAGCQNFVIADFDKVERSNLNRQPYIEKDIGKPKVEALAKKILDINPSCEIRKFLAVSQQNIDKILRGVDVIVLSLDGPVGSILVAREARNRDIPLVEGWATPLVFSWWFTRDSIDYETCYGLNTHDLSIEQIKQDPQIQIKIKRAFMEFFLTIPDIKEKYRHDESAFQQMMAGKIGLRSFAPMVWGESIYLAHDVLFSGLLGRKEMCVAPQVCGFDFLKMKMVKYTPKTAASNP